MHDERRQWFWSRVDKSGDCWVWMRARDSHGYGQTQFGRASKIMRTHRIAWELTNGPIPVGMLVCHRCDNPPCCRPDHLFLGTKRDNGIDAQSKGRLRGVTQAMHRFHAVGETHGRSKLTNAQAREIKLLLATGGRPRDIAPLFGISTQTITNIKHGRIWRHI